MIAPGEKFGKLTVIKLAVAGDANHRKYLCSCQCGGEKIVSEDNLRDHFETIKFGGRASDCPLIDLTDDGK